MNQENFLLKSNGYLARNALPGHYLVLKPANKNGLEGRPTNGMFIAVPSTLKESVSEVPVASDRLQCVILRLNEAKILLINSYFPTDPRTDFDENELLVLFDEIKKIIDDNIFDHIVLGGDFNTDFKRATKFVSLVDEFVSDLAVDGSWNQFEADFTHEAENNGRTFTSLIDHFFWDKKFGKWVEDAGVLHVPENMSDHSPIYCKINASLTAQEAVENQKPQRYIPSWQKASDEQKESYLKDLEDRLKRMEIPTHCLDCRNVHCNAPDHIAALDDIMAQVIEAVEDSSKTLISTNRGQPKRKGRLPNWKEDIDPVKETAYFWNAVWKSAGKPLNCQLHYIMKRTRNVYHLAIRKKKRLLERIKSDKMLKSCLNKDADIFKEIRKQRTSVQSCTTTIDGRSDDIPEYLAGKYEKLYNQVDDKENLAVLESNLRAMITDDSLTFVDRINSCAVKSVIEKKLKPAKKDPVADISSDYLIHAPDELFDILARCFKSYITHSHVSGFLLVSSLVPLLKDKLGDITSSNNYRSIAISSLVLKVFDLLIISLFSEYLNLDDLQFAYQSGVSTSMCTWVAVETISYFLRNGSEMYTCLMDMSKAFDTVQHSHLFKKLLDQGMPPIIVRYILVSYKYQKANVRWNGEESRYFDIGNGVKQGAILSAILYCVYTNGLFEELRRRKIGCFVTFVGILGYADDLYLMSPSLDGLQDMLSVCEHYAIKRNLKFSTDTNPSKSKTKCMAYLYKERELRKLELCGNKLPWVKNGKHLGMRIDAIKDNLLTKDVMEKRARYIQRNNELVQEFSYANSATKAFINRTFNSDAYGSVLWDLFGKETQMLYNTWSVSVRKMFKLDRKTHRYLIEPISGMEHLKCAIHKRFISFTEKLSSSPKTVVKDLYRKFGNDCRSTTGSNLRRVMLHYNTIPFSPTPNEVSRKGFEATPEGEEWRSNVIHELIDVRDGAMKMSGWTLQEIEETLVYLCTT